MSVREVIFGLSDIRFAEMVTQSGSLSDLVRNLGYNSGDSRVRKFIRDRMDELDIVSFDAKPKHQYTLDELMVAVSKSICWSDVVRFVGLGPYGGNIQTVKNLVAQHNIDISHFDIGVARSRGNTDGISPLRKDPNIHRSTVRSYVRKHNIIPYECLWCSNNGTWREIDINLQLDHIDGDPTNHVESNLRWLCPNCHSQTLTFGRRKRK